MALFRRKQADPPSVPETVELDGRPFRHHHGWSSDAMRHWLPTHAARHDGSGEMNHELFSSNDGSGEYLLDFLLSHHEAGTPAWEWNAARFARAS